MAATPFDPSHLVANPFDIYTDASVIQPPNPILPGGACNFIDLTPGANGSRCGCRRFWSRCTLPNLAPDQTQWCMCNHHACFHEEGDRDAHVPEANLPGQENERPRTTGREPLSPVMDMALKTPPAVPGMDFGLGSFSAGGLSFLNRTPEDPNQQPRITVSPQPGPSLPGNSIPDTLNWGDLMQSQPDANLMPPIPPQCLMVSQTASTASSAQAKYLRPFAGKGLQTLSGISGTKPPTPLKDKTNIPKSSGPTGGFPLRPESFVFVTQDQARPDNSQEDSPTQVEPRAVAAAGVSTQAFKNLAETVSGHDQRLDRLETVSFSAPGHDECIEKHEHADVRLTELESRVEEVEKLVNDNGSVVSRRIHADDVSVASFATNLTARPTHSQELYSQVQSLQAQVLHLRALVPSSSHPWEVEIVFLPFPLKKVWQDANEFKTEPQLGDDEWTQLPMTHSTATMRSQSPLYPDWASPEHDSDWLLPRAFGENHVVNRRLRSRGLVKTVTVNGSDARSVNLALISAFSGVFREMQLASRSQAHDPRVSTYLGLQSTWIPLRKIHKDSRLRFLSPSEMVTPATWDVQFLSSVMMRASEPRLFITHPDAYLQDFQSYETGWTWQRLREMNNVSRELRTSQEATQLDPSLDCWAWVDALDEAQNTHSSMSAPSSRQRGSATPSQPFFPAVQSLRTSSPMLSRAQSPLLAGRRGSRPPQIRTASMPMSATAQQSPASSRRRVASYGHSRRSSPAVFAAPQSAIMKHRHTRSPSHHRFTPRWTTSPSPMPLSERQPPRGTTPFAYATPYSNAPLQEMRAVPGGSIGEAAQQYASDDDPDFNMDFYESGSDDMYADDDDESVGSVEMVHAQPNTSYDSQGEPLPEDEPWPGLEDRNQLSDGENIDPLETDQLSDVSSQPSEYPSTQSAWPGDGAGAGAGAGGFHIHVDDESGQRS